MAKKKKIDLFEVLKFTPVTVNLMIQGYGGECYAGTVDRKIYDYFKKHKIDLDEYASDWDNELNVPDEFQPFSPGSAYDCDNLFHASGAELSDLNEIQIYEEDSGKELWTHTLGYDDLESSGVTVEEVGGGELYDLINGDESQVVFWGGQGEKGCFFAAEFELRAPFDPKKLKIGYENCDGWAIVSSVEYDGEDLDGCGGYSTTGKWGESKWILFNDEEVYESVYKEDRDEEQDVSEWPKIEEENVDIDLNNGLPSEDWDPAKELDKICAEINDEFLQQTDEFDDADKTEWFPIKVKPVRKGVYECQLNKIATWPWPNEGMLEWTGRSWKDLEGSKAKPYAWRGLKEKTI